MRDPTEARTRSLVHSSVEQAPAKRPEIDGGRLTSSLVRHVVILAIANVLVVILLSGLSAAPRPNDRILYVVFSPFDDSSDDKKKIVAAGGRVVEETTWPFVYKVTLERDDGLTRLEAGGVILALAASRLPICSAPRERA